MNGRDWWEVQSDRWPAGQFLIVSTSETATVGSTLALAEQTADGLFDEDPQTTEVRLYHVDDGQRRFYGWRDRGRCTRRMA